MSKFRVGQRVRKVSYRRIGDRNPTARVVRGPLGAVGVIARPSNNDGEWFVEWEGYEDSSVHPYQIEPLSDYDGNTVTTWAQTVWKPYRVRV